MIDFVPPTVKSIPWNVLPPIASIARALVDAIAADRGAGLLRGAGAGADVIWAEAALAKTVMLANSAARLIEVRIFAPRLSDDRVPRVSPSARALISNPRRQKHTTFIASEPS